MFHNQEVVAGENPKDTFAHNGSIPVEGSDFCCLKEEVWLNDNIINSFSEYLMERDNIQHKCCKKQRSYIFNTYILSQAKGKRGGYKFNNIKSLKKNCPQT